MSHVLCVDTIDFNNLIANLEDRVIIKNKKLLFSRRSAQQIPDAIEVACFTKIMKFLTVSNLIGTQLFKLQNFAILTSTDNNLSNLCSLPLSLSAGDWLLKKNSSFHGAQVQSWWSDLNDKCAQIFHKYNSHLRMWHQQHDTKQLLRNPEILGTTVENSAAQATQPTIYALLALGDSVYKNITYIQATINSSWSTFCNLKDKQRHILKFSTTTNAESKATCATTQLYSVILFIVRSNSRFLLLTTHTSQINCEGLLHQYSSNLFIWNTISCTSNIRRKHQHLLIRKTMKGNIHEITNIRYSCTSTHHRDIWVEWRYSSTPS